MAKHRIVVTLIIEGDYGHMEANPDLYDNCALTRRLEGAFTTAPEGGKSISPQFDKVWVEEFKDLDFDEETGEFVSNEP